MEREDLSWCNSFQKIFIPPAYKVAGVYSDPYIRPFILSFVRSSVRPSVPPNL